MPNLTKVDLILNNNSSNLSTLKRFLKSWLADLYGENHPNYSGSAYLIAITEEGTPRELIAAIRREIEEIASKKDLKL